MIILVPNTAIIHLANNSVIYSPKAISLAFGTYRMLILDLVDTYLYATSKMTSLFHAAAVMFNLPDTAIVKKVVHSLPRVGVGTNLGLPQTRYLLQF